MTPASPLLETRRLRTWQSDTTPAGQAWRIIARFSAVRAIRTWWIASLLVVILVALVVTVGGWTYSLASGDGVHGMDAGAAIGFAMFPAILLLLVLGAPLLADDLRFNALLFYYSRPVTRGHYIRGKVAFLGGLLALSSLLPLIVGAVGLLITAPFAEPDQWWQDEAYAGYYTPAERQARLEEWQVNHVDTFPDAAYVTVFGLAGLLSPLVFLTGATLLASAWTNRGWHAALALCAMVGLWSALGGMAMVFVHGPAEHLFGPGGWFELVAYMPFELRFQKPLLDPGDAWQRTQLQGYDGAWPAIAGAHLLLLGFGALFAWLAWARVRKVEASA